MAGLTVVMLTACSGSDAPTATQVVAKVNKEELTIHQVNYLLARLPGGRSEGADEKGRGALESLIDQSLAIQKAKELDLDHDPEVLREIDFARRDVLARAYAKHVASGVTEVAPERIHQYFVANPLLFAERRVYELEDWSVAVAPEQRSAVESQLRQGTVEELAASLKARGIAFNSSPVIRPAEQLPLRMLPALSSAPSGHAFVLPGDGALRFVVVRTSRLEPVSEENAKPAIEQFLLNDARRAAMTASAKSLRASAKVEYVGAFAEKPAASAEAAPGASTAASSASVEATDGAGLGNIR